MSDDKFNAATQKSYEAIAELYSNKHAGPSNPLKALYPHLDLDLSGARVLDIGCGAGRDARALIEAGARVVGIDYAYSMIEKAAAAAPQGQFYIADIRGFTTSEHFDLAWANAVLHHLSPTDLAAALASIAQMLTDRGKLAFASRVDVVRQFDNEYPGNPRYYYGHDEETYRRFADHVGLKPQLSLQDTRGGKTWLFMILGK